LKDIANASSIVNREEERANASQANNSQSFKTCKKFIYIGLLHMVAYPNSEYMGPK